VKPTPFLPANTPARAGRESSVTQKVLIVDDSKLARMAIVKALDALRPDWTRIEAADAATALEIVRRDAPDIAVFDFNMPSKDGLTLAAEVRQLNPQIHLAVISANQQLEVVRRARATGAAFLPKPLTVKALGEFLDEVAGPAQQVPG
jgi:YesN/AraC family two-component response regulator